MDTWIKAAQKQAAKLGNEVQKRADELQQNASALAQDVLTTKKDGDRQFRFQEGPLGFELDGAIVSAITEGGQAAQHGIEVGDRVIAIAGYPVPKARSATDVAGERRARAQIKQWMDEFCRPGNITFAARAPPESEADKPQPEEPAVSSLGQDHQSPPADDTSNKVAGSEADTQAGVTEGEFASRCSSDDASDRVHPELLRLQTELRAVQDQNATLQAELRIVQEHSQGLESELDASRAECEHLRHLAAQCDDGLSTAQTRLETQVRSLQQQLGAKKDEHDTLRRQFADLQGKLSEANSRCAELQVALSQNEQIALETSQGREEVLEAEVARLRRELSRKDVEAHANLRIAEETKERLAALETTTSWQELSLKEMRAQVAAKDSAVRELHKLREEHVALIAELREDRDRSAHALQVQEQRLSREIEDLRSSNAKLQERLAGKLEDAGEPTNDDDSGDESGLVDSELVKAVAASLEAFEPAEEETQTRGDSVGDGVHSCVVQSAEAASTPDALAVSPQAQRDDAQVTALQERISYLEGRCASLQKKVNSRPIVCQAYRPASGPDALEAGGLTVGQALPWEPQLRAALGPVASSYVVLCHVKVDRVLRRFTERLLKNSTWLWLFYAHVLVLYTLTSSCSVAETAATAGNPVDALGKTLEQGATMSVVAGSTAGAPGHR